MFNERFSHGKKFNINSDGFPFTTLDEVIEENGNKVIPVCALFTYKAKYGERPVIVSPTLKINLPDHCLNDVKEILSDDELIAAINNGKCGFKPSQYEDKNGNVRNSGSFIDI